MKLIFLDIDGVLNCAETEERMPGNIYALDADFVERFLWVIEKTGAKVVLSSTWRLHEDTRNAIKAAGIEFFSCTPSIPMFGGAEQKERGKEIMRWLATHPEHKDARYAILDDDSDFYRWQPLFKTTWQRGLTQEIADAVIKHLNHGT